jgi:hypothetical protein
MNNNKDPLSLEYFEDVLDLFYTNLDKNEKLYEELHDSYNNNKSNGFSLGISRANVEITKTLATIRSTAITGTSQVFAAKKSLAELELKKKQQIIDENKVENDKEFIRNTLSEIQKGENKDFKIGNKKEKKNDKEELDKHINSLLENKRIKITKNDAAMKYDFDDKSEAILDSVSGEVKVIDKNTGNELKDYPVNRINIGKVIRVDNERKTAYTENGKTIRVVEIKDE